MTVLIDDNPAAFDVQNSVRGRRWVVAPVDDRHALGISQGHSLPEIVGRVLAARGVGFDEVPHFLQPTLRGLMPDPSSLKDMDKAAARIGAAIMDQQPVTVFGDYDVDGATSSALLKRFIRMAGHDACIYIPDRIDEGYGLNVEAIKAIQDKGAELLIAVDCGTTSFEPLEDAAARGLDVVVLDHHQAEAKLPPAHALVNPNRLDESGDLGYLAACGLTFMTIVAVNRYLRSQGYYNDDRPEPNLTVLLDLVALGTVCDVVPLKGLNRAFTIQGLKVMARRGNPGIAALADIAKLQESPTAWHLGFLLGPRINAAGRIGQADIGASLLSTDCPATAAELSQALQTLNDERKDIEKAVLRDARAMIEGDDALRETNVIVVAGEGWHPGVIGIVASRLKEKYQKPVFVIAIDDNGIGKGSGRSVPGVDLGAAVIAARQSGMLVNGGGHEMAAGLTVTADKIDELRLWLHERVQKQFGGEAPVPELILDGTLSPRGVTMELAAKIDMMQPFGSDNPEPRFALTNARINKTDVLGGSHVRCYLSDINGGTSIKGMAFRSAEGELGKALMTARDRPLHLAGVVKVNRWNGRESAEFHIEDAAPAW